MRDLSRKLAMGRHERHDLLIAAVSKPLDHVSTLQIDLLQGDAQDIHAYAEKVFAERGVRHGRVAFVPLEAVRSAHPHGDGPARNHMHLKVRESF